MCGEIAERRRERDTTPGLHSSPAICMKLQKLKMSLPDSSTSSISLFCMALLSLVVGEEVRMAAGLRQGSTWRNQPPEKSRNVAIGDGKDTKNLNERVSLVYRKCGCVVELGMVGWWGFLGDETPKA